MPVQIKGYVCTTREWWSARLNQIEGRVSGKIGRVADKHSTDINKVKRKSNSRGDEWETFRQLLH